MGLKWGLGRDVAVTRMLSCLGERVTFGLRVGWERCKWRARNQKFHTVVKNQNRKFKIGPDNEDPAVKRFRWRK